MQSPVHAVRRGGRFFREDCDSGTLFVVSASSICLFAENVAVEIGIGVCFLVGNWIYFSRFYWALSIFIVPLSN